MCLKNPAREKSQSCAPLHRQKLCSNILYNIGIETFGQIPMMWLGSYLTELKVVIHNKLEVIIQTIRVKMQYLGIHKRITFIFTASKTLK